MKSVLSYAWPLVAVTWFGCATVDLSALEVHVPVGAPEIGTNLAGISDWSTELTSVDIFKGSRKWQSGTVEVFQDERKLDLDDAGWVRSLEPDQVARTLMLSNEAHYPTGKYVATYEGTGTLEFQFSGKTERAQSQSGGRYVLDVDRDTGGFSLMIVATDPNDYIRNIHIVLPGGVCEDGSSCDEGHACDEGICSPYEQNYRTQIFYPGFLDSLEGYSVLRFMDWMQTNDSVQRTFGERPTDRDASWANKGVPIEVMVELANRSGRDPWFCIPHLADDNYVENFALYVHDHLAEGRKAYVEYSNEVWNGNFPQAEYARAQGVAQQLGQAEFDSQLHFYARRTTEIHKIWERVFEGERQRLVRVVASQSDNDWVSNIVLGFEDTAQHADVLAIAPYFGPELGAPEQLPRVERMALDDLFAELRDHAVPTALHGVARQARVATVNHLTLVAYEGGQHLVGLQASEDSVALNSLFDAANRDPRMKAVYASYLQGWRNNGGHTFTHFTSCAVPTKYGRWGAREWMQQPRAQAPKLDALLDFVAGAARR